MMDKEEVLTMAIKIIADKHGDFLWDNIDWQENFKEEVLNCYNCLLDLYEKERLLE